MQVKQPSAEQQAAAKLGLSVAKWQSLVVKAAAKFPNKRTARERLALADAMTIAEKQSEQ